MHIPAHFAENRPEQLQRIIREHPVGTQVTNADGGLDADHLPCEFDSSMGPHGLLLARLTRSHEAAEPTPWKMGDSAPDYIDSMPHNIVGIEIAITSLVGKNKLSQNRELRDRIGAADTLQTRDHTELAGLMRPE